MNDFFKYWTIANMVLQIINNFVIAGGPSVNPILVANEASKELNRLAFNGYIPKSFLDGHERIIREAINAHPSIQNFPDDSVAAVLD